MATADSKTNTLYVSFNPAEFERLRLVGFRERWLYNELKWLANFKTGVVGNFFKQSLSYAKLAKLVTVPEEQGRDRGLCSIDDKEAARILDRLEKVGLVANIHRNARGGLEFTLPLSPLGAKTGDTMQSNVAKAPEKLPDDWSDEEPAEPLRMGPPANSGESRSVLKDSYESYYFSSDSSIDGAADTAAPETPLPESAASADLTIQSILHRLNNSRAHFIFLDTRDSRRIFEGWIERRIKPQTFEQVVRRFESNLELPATPYAIDSILRGPRNSLANPRNGHRYSGRGKVAL